jgi:protein CpxP
METQNLPSLPNLPDRAPFSSPSSSGPRERRRRGFLAGIALGALVAGLVGFAIGAATPVANAALGALGRHGLGHGAGTPPSPEEIREHAGFFVGFALHRLDATPDQEERVQKIVGSAIDELFPVVTRHRANRDALHEILVAPAIDREAIEKLRAQEMELADSLSRVLATAIGDAADVLSSEQRSTLVEHLQRFRHRG